MKCPLIRPTARRVAGSRKVSHPISARHACPYSPGKTWHSTRCILNHKSLNEFVEASRAGCYICSWRLAALPGNAQESLGPLGEGKMPDSVIARGDSVIWDTDSDPRAGLRDFLRDHDPQSIGAVSDEGGSWVPFTGMRIRLCRPNQWRILVLLNPLYEGYFPLSTTVYDSWLGDLWKDVAYSMSDEQQNPVVIDHEDYLKLGLMTAELPSNTGSMATWATVAGWIQQCSVLHGCMSNVNPDWYPTRLVEFMSNDTFRIIRSDSDSFQSKGGYVTLSHRWGSSDFEKLTTSNLAAFEIGSPITILRKTFQEAIRIAHRMAIPYIWIDSLCIIQSGDGGADWREESAKMAQVYSNSLCNISADWGDESKGLFFERTSTFQPPCELRMPWKHGGHYHIVRPGGWAENVMDSPLNRRGWVLQERQLAPRILHFSPQGVSWECGARTAWERTPSGFSDPESASACGMFECAGTILAMRRLRLREPDVAVDGDILLREYTNCELTEQSDRLVAVAGIAKVLTFTAEDQYVAGIWSKTLPKALVWCTDLTPGCSPATSYSAPSFSWASAEGRLSCRFFPDCQETLDSTSATFVKYREKLPSSFTDKTVRAKLFGQHLNDDVFGPMTVPEVEIRMQGILRACRRVPAQQVGGYWTLAVDSCVYPSTDVEDSARSFCFGKRTTYRVIYDRAAEEAAQSDSNIYCYTIILYTPTEDHEPSPSTSYEAAEGILLKSVDPSMGRFERVGYISHEYEPENDFAFGNILLPLGTERELPAWSYNETTGRHTFYIV